MQAFFRVLGKNGFFGWLISLALGGFAILGQAPFHLWPITIVCFALFMLRLDTSHSAEKPLKSAIVQGWGFGLGYFLCGLYWIGSAFIARGPEFIPIMPFAIFALCAALALFWALAAWVYIKTSIPTHNLRALVFVSVFFIVEFARGHILSGFPWNLPGTVFEAGKPISQTASIVGVYGLNAIVLFCAAGLALSLQTERRLSPALLSLAFLIGLYGFGAARLKNAKVEYVDGALLRIVHADIPQSDKFDPNKYAQTVNHYISLTTSAGFDKVTHVIWPEGAVPGLMFENQNLMDALENIFIGGGGETPPVFITQVLRAETKTGELKPKYYNAAAAITYQKNKAPEYSAFYDKRKLVPFGEYLPGQGLLEKVGLTSLSTAIESMTPGETGIVPMINGLPPVSIQICYEINFSGMTPKRLLPSGEKPEWILNLSNDAWYGRSTGPYQQANQARYRAIEEGLPLVRSTSGGISSVTDPYGRIISARNLGEDSVLDARLPRHVHKTAYNTRVNYIILLLIGFMQLGCYLVMRRGRQLHIPPQPHSSESLRGDA